MQMQPYSRSESLPVPLPEQRGPLAERNGHHSYNEWNGYSGYTNGYAPNGQPQHLKMPSSEPSYIQVLFQQIQKRWRVLVIWLIVTAGIAAVVILKFAQPQWKAEGKLYYAPDYTYGQKRLYTPPNIQTVLALAKSTEILDQLAQEQNLGSGSSLQNKVNVAIIKNSDIISVAFEWPIKEKAEAGANRVLQLAIEEFERLRRKLSEKSLVDLDKDLKKAFDDELAMRKKLNESLGKKNIFDLKTETTSLIHEIDGMRRIISDLELEERTLEKRIKALDKEIERIIQENSQRGVGLTETERLNLTASNELKSKISQEREKVEKAKIKLKPLEDKRLKWLPLFQQGYITRIEMDELVRDIDTEKAVVSLGLKEIARMEESLQRLEQTSTIPDELKLVKREKSRFEIDQSVIPGRIAALKKILDERLQHQKFLQGVEKEALQIQQVIEDLQQRRLSLSAKKQDHEKLEANQMSELTIHVPASAGNAPASSNHVKLGAGTVGLSLLLFVGFIALWDMPRAWPRARAEAMPPASMLPVPIWQHSPLATQASQMPPPPSRGASVNNDQLRVLAERIAFNASERGKIVLFTPTAKGLRLENLLGDLAGLLTKDGGKVLVFEARGDAESPSYPAWAGAGARGVADELEGYLEGRSERTAGCFAETLIPASDYARGDLARQLQGVMAMYRFRRLMNDMKERYSMVLMVTPERYQGEEDDVFTTLGEGIVVVINQDADPSDVEQYLRELRACETPVYGAFTVPPGQAH